MLRGTDRRPPEWPRLPSDPSGPVADSPAHWDVWAAWRSAIPGGPGPGYKRPGPHRGGRAFPRTAPGGEWRWQTRAAPPPLTPDARLTGCSNRSPVERLDVPV